MEFDPFDYGFHRDPYPTYQWLREHAPVYHNERMDFWAFSRFDDVLDGLHDPDTYTSTGGVAIEHTDAALKSMIELDPPEHTQMRKLIARRFTPRRIAELEPRVPRRGRTSCSTDSTAVTSSTSCASSPRSCPTTVVGTMLGIPADRHDDARRGPTTSSPGSRATRCRPRPRPKGR